MNQLEDRQKRQIYADREKYHFCYAERETGSVVTSGERSPGVSSSAPVVEFLSLGQSQI